ERNRPDAREVRAEPDGTMCREVGAPLARRGSRRWAAEEIGTRSTHRLSVSSAIAEGISRRRPLRPGAVACKAVHASISLERLGSAASPSSVNAPIARSSGYWPYGL